MKTLQVGHTTLQGKETIYLFTGIIKKLPKNRMGVRCQEMLKIITNLLGGEDEYLYSGATKRNTVLTVEKMLKELGFKFNLTTDNNLKKNSRINLIEYDKPINNILFYAFLNLRCLSIEECKTKLLNWVLLDQKIKECNY